MKIKRRHLREALEHAGEVAAPPDRAAAAIDFIAGGVERARPGSPVVRETVPANASKSWNIYKDGVTQSIIGRYLSCPEKVHLGMEERLGAMRTTGALSFGSLVHEALDWLYTGFMKNHTKGVALNLKAVSADLAVWMKEKLAEDRRILQEAGAATEATELSLEENFGMAEIVLNAYFRRWTRDYDHYEWLALEKEFCVPYVMPSGNIIPVRGKIDGVMRIRDKLWLFETKTKARIEDEAIVSKLNFDLQVLLYMWAMQRIYGEKPMGVIYNLIRRPQLRRTQKEMLSEFLERIRVDIETRPEFYFIRYEAAILPHETARWELEFLNIMTSIEQWANGAHRFRNSSACSGMFGTCEYIRYCAEKDETGLIRREQLFPELAAREE